MNINGSANIQGIYEVLGTEKSDCFAEQKKEKREKKGRKEKGGEMQKNRGKSQAKGWEKKGGRETEGRKEDQGRKKKEIDPKNGRKEKKIQKEKSKSSLGLRRNRACKGFTDECIKGLCRVGPEQGVINIARCAVSEASKNQKLLKAIKASVLRIIKKLCKIGSGRACGRKKEKKRRK